MSVLKYDRYVYTNTLGMLRMDTQSSTQPTARVLTAYILRHKTEGVCDHMTGAQPQMPASALPRISIITSILRNHILYP